MRKMIVFTVASAVSPANQRRTCSDTVLWFTELSSMTRWGSSSLSQSTEVIKTYFQDYQGGATITVRQTAYHCTLCKFKGVSREELAQHSKYWQYLKCLSNGNLSRKENNSQQIWRSHSCGSYCRG